MPVTATEGYQIGVEGAPCADDADAPGADGPWMAISATVTGATHRRAGIDSQDAIHWEPHDQRQSGWLALAVADGHGHSKYFRSDVGAKLAAEVASRLLAELPSLGAPAQIARYVEDALAVHILRGWQQLVRADSERLYTSSDRQTSQSVTRNQRYDTAYGTTLLAALVTDEYIVCAQIGDGSILFVDEAGQRVDYAISKDPRLLGVETTSLSARYPLADLRTSFHWIDNHPPALILLSTDGLVNSFVEEEGFIQVGRDLLRVAYGEGMGALAVKAQDLVQRATDEGCGDDVTLGILCHLPTIQLARNGKAHSTLGEKEERGVDSLLQTGETVQIVGSRKSCTVRQLLGAGGQGEVYRAECDGKDYALKWYFPRTATDEQRATLETLVDKGAPTQRFLWPEALLTKPGEHGFGYLMGLRPIAFKGLVDLVTRRVEPSFRAKATMGYELGR